MTISDYKQLFIDTLENMELNFFSFRLVQQRMNQAEISAGQGWEKTKENIMTSFQN